MAKESVQKKLERVRPPRVHITYDVEVGDAIEVKELPFVMGIFADLSGQPLEALPKLKERRFVEINPDNFDGVLEASSRICHWKSTTSSATRRMLARSR